MSDLSIHKPSSYDIQEASQEAEPPSPTTSSKGEPSAAGAHAAAEDPVQPARLADQYPAAGSGTGEPSGPQAQLHPAPRNPAAGGSRARGAAQGSSRGRKGPPLSLNLPAAASAAHTVAAGGGRAQADPATAKLNALNAQDKQDMRAEMGKLPKPTFSPATKFPTYAEFQQGHLNDPEKSGKERENEHYGFGPSEGFTEANRKSGSTGDFEGQKIHISVDPNNTEKAYQALAPMLFSADSPIERFKMTDMEAATEAASKGVDGADRVSQGAQFTMYLKTNPKTGDFDAEHLNKIQSFVGEVGNRLQESGVSPGTRPGSDANLPGNYASFRNERNDRKQDAEVNKKDPVYQILNH